MNEYEKLIQYALRIISKKRYTSFEMDKKLWQFVKKIPRVTKEGVDETEKPDDNKVNTEAVSAVLERLKELKYLDDLSYVNDYIADRKKFRPRGKFLLARELKNKGLDSDLIQNALEKQNSDEFEAATRALEKKSRQWQDLPLQKWREKAFRFLSARGFEQEAIYKAVNYSYNRNIK